MRRGLVVDDDVTLREMLAEALETVDGVRCTQAGSLDEVKARAGDLGGYSFAILDVNLGIDEPSGIEVHAWLVSHGFPGKIVFLTGHARSHPLIQAACRIHGVALIEKPTTLARLEQVIRG